MLKEFSWKAFEKTGNINAYIFYKEMQNIETDDLDQPNVEYEKEFSLTS